MTVRTFLSAGSAPLLTLAAIAHADYTGMTVEQFSKDFWASWGYTDLTTYRIYADFDSEDDVLLAVHGSSLGALEMHSSNGAFFNPEFGDSLTAPHGVGEWWYDWDTYVTIDGDSDSGDATALSPGFGDEVGYLKNDFTTSNAAWYVTPDDAPQGLADGYRVMIAQLTVDEGEHVWGTVNLFLSDGSHVIGAAFPAPGAILSFALAGLFRSRRRSAALSGRLDLHAL